MLVSVLRQDILLVLITAWFGLVALPWYGVANGFWSFAWLQAPTSAANASGLLQALLQGRSWLWPLPVLLIIALVDVFRAGGPRASFIAWCGGLGFFYLLLQGPLYDVMLVSQQVRPKAI